MSIEEVSIEDTDPAPEPRPALLFDLEHVAIDGRQIAFDVVKTVFADRDVAVTPPLFVRYCLDAPVATYTEALLRALDKPRLSAAKIAGEIAQGVRLTLSGGNIALRKGCAELIDSAEQRGMAIGAISFLGADLAEQVFKKAGFDAEKIVLHAIDEDAGRSLRSQAWEDLARRVGTPPGMCVALAADSATCRAALVSGVRCSAVPDAYSAYQDLGGVDYVFEEMSPDILDDLCALTRD